MYFNDIWKWSEFFDERYQSIDHRAVRDWFIIEFGLQRTRLFHDTRWIFISQMIQP